jgi:hypothetical protein
VALKKAEVRFYFDADILGLAKVICALRFDSTFPGDPGATIHKRRRPACIVPSVKWKDGQWIPPVAKQGWIAITRDSDILDHLSLLHLIQDHALRFVAITGDEGANKWGQLEIVMTRWRDIEALTQHNGPLLYTCTRTSFKQIDIQKRLDEVRRVAADNPHHPSRGADRSARRPQGHSGETSQGSLFDRTEG